jgi:hypothetical protein
VRPSRILLLSRCSRPLLIAAPAHAIIRLPAVPTQVAHNPAERLLSQPIEDSVYDPAAHCTRKKQRRWLEANVWHLDAHNAADRRAGWALKR